MPKLEQKPDPKKKEDFKPYRVFVPVEPAWGGITYKDLAKPSVIDEAALTEISQNITYVSNSLGVGTVTQTAQLESFSATRSQLLLRYGTGFSASFDVDSVGDLYLRPTGGSLYVQANSQSADMFIDSDTDRHSILYLSSDETINWSLYKTATAHDFRIDSGSGQVFKIYQTTGNIALGSAESLLWDHANLKFSLTRSNTAITPHFELFQSSTGDSGLRFTETSSHSYIIGVDNTDDAWKVSYGAAGNAVLGTNDYLSISTAGVTSISSLALSGFTTGSVLFYGASAISQNNASFFWDNTNGGLSLNGTTTPAGVIARSGLVLAGGDNGTLPGPFLQAITTADTKPLFTVLPFKHDLVELWFDTYADAGFVNYVSASSNSNFIIAKTSDAFVIAYARAVTAGTNIGPTLSNALIIYANPAAKGGVVNCPIALTCGTALADIVSAGDFETGLESAARWLYKQGSGRASWFSAANSETVRISTSENSYFNTASSFGFFTTTPRRGVDILNASNPQLRLTHTDNSVYVEDQATSAGDLKQVYSSTTTPLYFGCVASGSSPYVGISDRAPDGSSYFLLGRASGGDRYINAVTGGTIGFSIGGGANHFEITTVGFIFNESGADYDFRIEGDSISHLFFTDATATTENIALLAAAAPNWQSMDRGLFIGNTSTAPTGNPASGHFYYDNAGTPTWRSSGGAIMNLSQATGGENVTNNVTDTASTAGTIPDITNGTVYATDYTNLRNALFQLARMLKQDHDQLRAMGILT